jgi:hypothetical protein
VTSAEVEINRDTRRVSAPVRDRVGALTEVLRALDDAGIAAEDIALQRPTLDEVFLHRTGSPPFSVQPVARPPEASSSVLGPRSALADEVGRN